MRTLIFVFFMASLAVPFSVDGAVLTNEIAWMGTNVSSNNEWLELFNNGSTSVSVNGWVLGDGASLVIPLSGTIGAWAYVVLERTDDSTVPGMTAFLTYTGALSNDGRTLTLYRADGGIEDQVVGGTGWKNIGGDNTTKFTAQRTATGWMTASPTPGKPNGAPTPKGTSITEVSPNTRRATPLRTPPLPIRADATQTNLLSTERVGIPRDSSLRVEASSSGVVTPSEVSTVTIPIGNTHVVTTKGSFASTTNRFPYLGLVAIILLATVVLYRTPTTQPEKKS